MKTISYEQDPNLGVESFTLEDSRVIVVSKYFAGKKIKTVHLRYLIPSVETVWRRVRILWIVPSIWGCCLAVLAWVTFALLRWPGLFALVLGGGSLSTFHVAWRGLKPREVSLFRGRDGEIKFEIFKPDAKEPAYNPTEYDFFIRALVERIKENAPYGA